MNRAVAFATNEVVFIAWTYDRAISQCLGFSIHRQDISAKSETTLPAWVGFVGGDNRNWTAKTTDEWPVQKFNWRDLTAKPGGQYRYRIVPRIGAPGSLKDAPKSLELLTNSVNLTPRRGSFSAYFNQGILSTQSVAHMLPQSKSGVPSSSALMKHITTPGDALRLRLAGQQIEALKSLLERAVTTGGECYGALYELSDPELLGALKDAGRRVHLILSNTGADDAENKPNRQPLRDAQVDLTDRMLANGHIGHNKFVVYVDKNGRPSAVLTGSTNWTSTGLCAQSNNALIIENGEVAAAYLDYWHRLKADTNGKTAEQSVEFRERNNHVVRLDAVGAGGWFSPNTRAKSKPAKNAAAPGDMSEVFQAISDAKDAVLFLVFQPGSPSVIDGVATAQTKKPSLIIRGAATDPKAVEQYDTLLFHGTATKADKVKDTSVVAASAIRDEFAYWHKELLKSSPSAHAIIHDKIVVIDPLDTKRCVVITGSHNLGYRASYNNDENLLIIRGAGDLATSYATHVMDVYDHYRWRFWVQSQGQSAWKGLEKTDAWQTKYFDGSGVRSREVRYWTRQQA